MKYKFSFVENYAGFYWITEILKVSGLFEIDSRVVYLH